ncbi:MAG: methyltransferase [bacterium]
MMTIQLSFLERLLHRFHLLPTPIMDSFGGIIFGRVLTIAVRRELFEALATGGRTVIQLADVTGLNEKAIRLMADSFVAGGYLTRSEDVYILSGEGKKWLIKSSPAYIGNLVAYFETLYARWEHFEYSLEHGRPERAYFDGFTDNDWKVYVYGMADLARLLLNEVGPKLALHDPKSLLDIGGSHGLYAMECCRRYPSIQATIMDFAPALQHACEIAAAEKMSGQINFLEGDFKNNRLPPNQDCVLLFNIVHGFDEKENQKLIERTHEALTPGGKLFILDQMKSSKQASGLAAFVPLMVGLNLLNEIGGNVYDMAEVKRWCGSFSSVQIYKLRLPGVILVEAVK